jgi:HD-like signal output (HDOD) protein
MIAQSWGLAQEIANVIAYHHQPDILLASTDLYEKRLFAILKLAEHMTGEEAILFDAQQETEWQHYGTAILDVLELDEMHLLDVGDFLLEHGVENHFHR